MDTIIANDKYDLAIRTFKKLAEEMSKNGNNLPETVPIVLIGGAALESYGIRDSGEDIDIFIPGEYWGGLDLDSIANEIMSSDPSYKRLKDSLDQDPDSDPDQQVIEMVKDRDLYTELDNGKFEDLVESLEEIKIGDTTFQFKMPDLATIAFSKSNSFRDKDIRDVSLIVERIGMERFMGEANRLRDLHGDDRIGLFVKDGLSEISVNLAMTNDYLKFIEDALEHLKLESVVMQDLYDSFGIDQMMGENKDIWPDDDWEPGIDRTINNDYPY